MAPSGLTAGPPRQRRATSRGRDGRLGMAGARALAHRAGHAPRRSAVLHHQRTYPRPPVDDQRCTRRAPARRGASRRSPTLRATPATARTRGRDGPRRRAADRHPAPTRTQQPRDHLGLSTGHRQRRNHRNGPRPSCSDDPRSARRPRATSCRRRLDPAFEGGLAARPCAGTRKRKRHKWQISGQRYPRLIRRWV
jgi:hypothetical protein